MVRLAPSSIPNSILRDDILTPELLEAEPRVIVSTVYSNLIEQTEKPRSATPHPAKNIVETLDLIVDAIQDYETRTHVLERDKIRIVYENPMDPIEYDTVTLSIARRQPGSFSQGAPFEGSVKNRRPLLREEFADPDNPGYRKAVLGYFHDNIIRITCWGLTNKSANKLMLKVEEIIEQYIWYFRLSGVNRFLYEQHGLQVEHTVNNARIYGRPIDYFCRTETIRTVSEKELEVVCVNLAIREGENL